MSEIEGYLDQFLDDMAAEEVVICFTNEERVRGIFQGYGRYGVRLEFECRDGKKRVIFYTWISILSIEKIHI